MGTNIQKRCQTGKNKCVLPYNPETNPIEMIFGPIKNYIRSNNMKLIAAIKYSIDDYIQNMNNSQVSF